MKAIVLNPVQETELCLCSSNLGVITIPQHTASVHMIIQEEKRMPVKMWNLMSHLLITNGSMSIQDILLKKKRHTVLSLEMVYTWLYQIHKQYTVHHQHNLNSNSEQPMDTTLSTDTSITLNSNGIPQLTQEMKMPLEIMLWDYLSQCSSSICHKNTKSNMTEKHMVNGILNINSWNGKTNLMEQKNGLLMDGQELKAY